MWHTETCIDYVGTALAFYFLKLGQYMYTQIFEEGKQISNVLNQHGFKIKVQ